MSRDGISQQWISPALGDPGVPGASEEDLGDLGAEEVPEGRAGVLREDLGVQAGPGDPGDRAAAALQRI